ncbi:XRE family transcriptional regulator [Hymenobacter rubripertinctus]|uniref:XRE family transcriptional regulator n=1 Tax=Hymenobacter rubripertinctus TaxID=2029981 RepID=UPI001FE4DAE2|nr:XRE family transcriptional regulator [Hymenobacter rubripertinctus]
MTEAEILPDPRLKLVGYKLRQLRIKKGYSSYEAFAFDHDLPRVGYGRHEQGHNLTLKSLLRLLDIHQASLADFFTDI